MMGLLVAWLGVAPLTLERLEARIVEMSAPVEAAFQIRLAFQDLILAAKKHDIWASERQSWERFILLNGARFGEGVIAERDLIRARVEGGLLDLEVSESRAELSKARRRLADLLGQPEVENAPLSEDFDSQLPRLALDKLPSVPGEIGDAALEYEIAREQIQTFHLRLLSPSEESLGIEELLYEQLKTGLVTLLEARRTRLSIELRYVELLHRAAVARLRLQRLLGERDLPT